MATLSSRHRRILLDLLTIPTAPFHEHLVLDYVRRFAATRRIPFRADRFGNLLLHYRHGTRRNPHPLALSAHTDHPGFEALDSPAPGRLRAQWMGGVLIEYFPGTRVRFHTPAGWVRGRIREVTGVNTKPPTTVRCRPDKVLVELPRRAVVPPGSLGMWDLPDPVIRGRRVFARDCDDIAGLAAILCALDALSARRAAAEVFAMITRAEEVGFAGCIAACAARTLPLCCAVVGVECSSRLAGAPQGHGPVLRVGDRLSIFSPQITSWCRAVADDLAKRDNSFRYQRKLMDGGSCESTAYCEYGYTAGGVCLSLGNYHNMDPDRGKISPEHIHLDDFTNLVKWFVALATTRTPFSPRPARSQPRWIAELRRRFEPRLIRTV